MRTPLSHEQCHESTRCFQNLVMGLEEALGCWKIVKLVFLRKPDAEQKRIRSYRTIALTSVMSKWYSALIILRLEKEKKNQKVDSSCTWMVLTVSAVSIFKY